MPLLNLQRQLRRIGKIRLGETRTSQRGKSYPAALDKFRLTSPFRDILDAAASVYGGEVTEWKDAPKGTGKQWELYTDTEALDVFVIAGEVALSQWMEMWSGGGCIRRCDQQTETISGEACLCPEDPDQRRALAAKGQACKETTRLNVLLGKLPDIGTWTMESHGYYAAVELGGVVELLSAIAPGRVIPGRLIIEHRSGMREGKRQDWVVPVLSLPTVTPHDALSSGEFQALAPPSSLDVGGPESSPELRRPTPPALPGGRPKAGAPAEAEEARPTAGREDGGGAGSVGASPASVPDVKGEDVWAETFVANVGRFIDVKLSVSPAVTAVVKHLDPKASGPSDIVDRQAADKALLALKRGRLKVYADINGNYHVEDTLQTAVDGAKTGTTHNTANTP